MNKTFVPYPVSGYTPTVKIQPATFGQLIALRDMLLSYSEKDAAAAVDNAIDVICQAATKLYTMGSVRKIDTSFLEPAERKAQADAISEKYEAEFLTEMDEVEQDWHKQVSELRGGG